MRGILKLAYKLLVNDKSKFTALLVGITFAVFLMMFITSMFIGVLNHSSSTVINIGASMWVMDPAVQTPANSIGMPDYILDAVRSIQGVAYAVPLYSGGALVKLPDGTYQSATVVGLDDTSLFGRPQVVEGNITDIYAENGFLVVEDGDYPKLGSPHVGSQFELNDHRGVIVGVAKVSVSGLFGIPTLYTTYERAIQYIPNPRYTTSYVLVEPKSTADIPRIKQEVQKLGYLALTKNEFIERTTDFYMFQTGVGMNILIMTIISFVVGLSISGQTFYTFILENLERFGALKAIGTTSRELTLMILFQATFTALTGYGLGVGLCTMLIAIAKFRLPDYAAMITYFNLVVAFVMVVIIVGISSYVGIRRVLQIEPFEIFRDDMPRVAIKASGVQKWFGEGEAKTYALRGVDLEANFGEMVYIVGPSGSGKTTLLSVLSGILRPNAGSVEVEGVDIWKLSADELANYRLHKIGFVFQDYHLFPRLNTAENVAIPLIIKRQDWDQSIREANKYLDVVGLKNRAELPPVKLSGGEQQRVAIARAVVSQPDILIMDEPTASLDGDTGRAVVSFVHKNLLNENRCIIVVTHDDRIYEFATRILLMEDGRLTGVKDFAVEAGKR